MTREQAIVSLLWPGTDTLEAARAAIRSGMSVDIELPLEVHYALYKRLHPDGPRASEDIDTSGGAELLEPIATVAGLEELGVLQAALRGANYRVRLTSPVPHLRLTPRDPAR
jgi:hypothetical protein